MASQTITRLVDDLDESDADETVSFALDGQSYEIDLSSDNASRLRDTLAEFVGAARQVGGARGTGRRGGGRRRGGRGGGGGGDTAEIRRWARENGYTVNDRGRIPSNVLEAYYADH